MKDDYSGNDYNAEEQRDGKSTSGQYQVLLPDGRVQIVRYSVDGYSGFVADVSYKGEPRYPPAPKYAPAPAPKYGY